jgi:opacity protein-like surface antigen
MILVSKKSLLGALALAVLMTSALSAKADDTDVMQPRRHEKSPKKLAADQATPNLPPAQVLEKGDSLLGLRFSHGDDFVGASMFGLSYENMLSSNFGIIGRIDYGSYSSVFGAGPIEGTWKYKIWAFTVMGALHADFLKVPNFDPYVSLGLGHSIFSTSWTSNVGSLEPIGADSSSFYIAAYLNFRYFLNSTWGLQASLGTGMGLLSLGVDCVF